MRASASTSRRGPREGSSQRPNPGKVAQRLSAPRSDLVRTKLSVHHGRSPVAGLRSPGHRPRTPCSASAATSPELVGRVVRGERLGASVDVPRSHVGLLSAKEPSALPTMTCVDCQRSELDTSAQKGNRKLGVTEHWLPGEDREFGSVVRWPSVKHRTGDHAIPAFWNQSSKPVHAARTRL
jgi:hypothetical protein